MAEVASAGIVESDSKDAAAPAPGAPGTSEAAVLAGARSLLGLAFSMGSLHQGARNVALRVFYQQGRVPSAVSDESWALVQRLAICAFALRAFVARGHAQARSRHSARVGLGGERPFWRLCGHMLSWMSFWPCWSQLGPCQPVEVAAEASQARGSCVNGCALQLCLRGVAVNGERFSVNGARA